MLSVLLRTAPNHDGAVACLRNLVFKLHLKKSKLWDIRTMEYFLFPLTANVRITYSHRDFNFFTERFITVVVGILVLHVSPCLDCEHCKVQKCIHLAHLYISSVVLCT